MKYLHVVCAVFAAPIRVTVDGDTVVARREAPLRYGVCMNYLMDGDRCDPQRKHPIRASLKKLGVKAVRWNEGEIGNENYLGDANWKPAAYAAIVNALGTAIKKANATARVGAQLASQEKWTSVAADGRSWNAVMRDRLNRALIDHFIVHQYGYRRTNNLDAAVKFHDALPAADRKRIDLTVTELGSWHLPGAKDRWSPNDLQTALYQFRWLGMVQARGKGKIRTPLFWTTRWLRAVKHGAYDRSFHALNMAGELTPSGTAIRTWNAFVRDTLVTAAVAGSSKDLYCYASRDAADPAQLAVWLANNHPDDRTISLELKGCRGAGTPRVYRFAGTGPADTRPVFGPVDDRPALKPGTLPSLDCRLPPYSLTVLQFGQR